MSAVDTAPQDEQAFGGIPDPFSEQEARNPCVNLSPTNPSLPDAALVKLEPHTPSLSTVSGVNESSLHGEPEKDESGSETETDDESSTLHRRLTPPKAPSPSKNDDDASTNEADISIPRRVPSMQLPKTDVISGSHEAQLTSPVRSESSKVKEQTPQRDVRKPVPSPRDRGRDRSGSRDRARRDSTARRSPPRRRSPSPPQRSGRRPPSASDKVGVWLKGHPKFGRSRKGVLCWHFGERGGCLNGDTCPYAHGTADLEGATRKPADRIRDRSPDGWRRDRSPDRGRNRSRDRSRDRGSDRVRVVLVRDRESDRDRVDRERRERDAGEYERERRYPRDYDRERDAWERDRAREPHRSAVDRQPHGYDSRESRREPARDPRLEYARLDGVAAAASLPRPGSPPNYAVDRNSAVVTDPRLRYPQSYPPVDPFYRSAPPAPAVDHASVPLLATPAPIYHRNPEWPATQPLSADPRVYPSHAPVAQDPRILSPTGPLDSRYVAVTQAPSAPYPPSHEPPVRTADYSHYPGAPQQPLTAHSQYYDTPSSSSRPPVYTTDYIHPVSHVAERYVPPHAQQVNPIRIVEAPVPVRRMDDAIKYAPAPIVERHQSPPQQPVLPGRYPERTDDYDVARAVALWHGSSVPNPTPAHHGAPPRTELGSKISSLVQRYSSSR